MTKFYDYSLQNFGMAHSTQLPDKRLGSIQQPVEFIQQLKGPEWKNSRSRATTFGHI